MEFELYVDGAVPSDVGARAIAAAMQVLRNNGVGILEAASAAHRRLEANRDEKAVAGEDYRIATIWDEANAVADAILNGGVTYQVVEPIHLAIRRALNRADASARDQWLNAAAAVFSLHGESLTKARTHAWREWLGLTHDENDIVVALAVDPTRHAARVALWAKNSGRRR